MKTETVAPASLTLPPKNGPLIERLNFGQGQASEMSTQKKPSVTFVLLAYNQEKYIREAIEGALTQTYFPLEIILSDDCSTDQTFEIMKEMSSQYLGKNKLTLNRNETNLGISLHVAHINKKVEGDIIVYAAGDDISDPDRTQTIVDAFLAEEDKPSLIESNAQLIDENGHQVGIYHQQNRKIRRRSVDPVLKLTLGGGATYAVHRTLIDMFDAPMPGIVAEDHLLNSRANMLDGILYIPRALIKYRISSTGAWNSMVRPGLSSIEVIKNEVKWTRSRILVTQQAILDANTLQSNGVVSKKETKKTILHLNRSHAELKRWLILGHGSFVSSTSILIIALLRREYIPLTRWFKLYAIRWIFFVPQMRNIFRRCRRHWFVTK